MRIGETDKDEKGEIVKRTKRYETTVGRAILSENPAARIAVLLCQQSVEEKEISKIINAAFRRCGIRETVIFTDQLMYTGFTYAAQGLSISIDDMLVPPQKKDLISAAEAEVKEIEAQYVRLVTQANATTRSWTSGVAQATACQGDDGPARSRRAGHRRRRKANHAGVLQRDLHDGGLRRTRTAAQIRQLAGMRGLMAKTGWLDHRDADRRTSAKNSTCCSTSFRRTARARV